MVSSVMTCLKHWVDGDINQLLESIDNISVLYQLLPHFQNAPYLQKRTLIHELTSASYFGDELPLNLWLPLIIQDDNPDIFTEFLGQRYNEFIQSNEFKQGLKNSPHCAWVFCSKPNNDNCINYNIFLTAMRYCLNYPTQEHRFLMIYKIWNVPSMYKFNCLDILKHAGLQSTLIKELITVNDLQNLLNNPQAQHIKLMPIIDIVMYNLPNLNWNFYHQQALLEELVEETDIVRTVLINKTMPMFTEAQQRQIWNSLKDIQRDVFEFMNWYEIDEMVVPCHTDVTEDLFHLLLGRKKLYHFGSRFIDFCHNTHYSNLRAVISQRLLSVANGRLWNTCSVRHIDVLINYWLSHIDQSEVLPAVDYVIDRLNESIGPYTRAKILSGNTIYNLMNFYDSSHEIFKCLLKKPYPDNFTPSLRVREGLYKKIPSLINLELYRRFPQDVCDIITENKVPLDESNICREIIIDTINNNVSFCSTLLNMIKLPIWTSLDSQLCDRVHNYLLEKLDNKDGENVLNTDILYEVFRKSTLSVPDDLKGLYLSYVVRTYGISEVKSEDILTLEYDFPIVLKEKSDTYKTLIDVCEAGRSNLVLSVEHSVLMDILEKNPTNIHVHGLLLKFLSIQTLIPDETVTSMKIEDLLKLYKNNFVEINEQQRLLLPENSNKLISNTFAGECPVCKNNIKIPDKMELPCKHVFHMECIQKWLATATGSSTCPMCRAEI